MPFSAHYRRSVTVRGAIRERERKRGGNMGRGRGGGKQGDLVWISPLRRGNGKKKGKAGGVVIKGHNCWIIVSDLREKKKREGKESSITLEKKEGRGFFRSHPPRHLPEKKGRRVG